MSQELTSSIVIVLLNSLWQGALIAGVGQLVLRLRKNRLNAATRYTIWYVVLVAIVTIPVARLAVMQAGLVADDRSIQTTMQEEASRTLSEDHEVKEHTILLLEEEQVRVAEPLNAVLTVPGSTWTYIVFWAWAGGVALLLIRIGLSYRSQRLLLRNARPLTAVESSDITGGALPVSMRMSDQIMTPMVGRFLRPVILLPDSIFDRFDQREREQIVRHEWAHIRRRDPLMKLMQRVVEACFWFHPVVWWIGKRLDLEREIACDDRTVSQSGGREAYAWCLTKLIEAALRPQPHLLVTTGLMERRQIEHRVDCLLDDEHINSPRLLKMRTTLGLLIIGITFISVLQAPALLAVGTLTPDVESSIPAQAITIPDSPPGVVLEQTLQRIADRDAMMKDPMVYALEPVSETELWAMVVSQQSGRRVRIDVKVDGNDTFVDMRMAGD